MTDKPNWGYPETSFPDGGQFAGLTTTTELWSYYLDLLKRSGDVVEASSLEESADTAPVGVDYLFQALASAYVVCSRPDVNHPEFVPLTNQVMNLGAPNPDFTYYFAQITGEGTYRISGDRGTVHAIDLQTGYDYVGFADRPGETFASQRLSDFAMNDDGTFELMLGPEKPTDLDGNWLTIDRRVNYIMLRMMAYRPDEVNARVAIERTDLEGVIAPVSPQQTDARVRSLLRWMQINAKVFVGLPRRQVDLGIVNRLEKISYGVGELQGQVYLQGAYRLRADEAMIIAVTIPEVFYWNITLSDPLWRALDFFNRQSSLNGHLDRADGDGVTRLVIAHRDPGCLNWVDTTGVLDGDVMLRFMEIAEDPVVTCTTLPFDDIGKHLPADTVMVTLAERREALRQRSIGYQLRRHGW